MQMQVGTLPPDAERWLRFALRLTPWVQSKPNPVRATISAQLAHDLMFAVGQVAATAPPRAPVIQTQADRKRAEGAGRKPNVTREILASGVRRAMDALNLPSGTWFIEGDASPALQVLRVCWWAATLHTEQLPSGRHRRRGDHIADSDDCGQRFQSKPDADSNRRQTVIPMIPDRIVVDVGYGVR